MVILIKDGLGALSENVFLMVSDTIDGYNKVSRLLGL